MVLFLYDELNGVFTAWAALWAHVQNIS